MQKVKFIFLELFLLKEFMNMISYSANLGHNSMVTNLKNCVSVCHDVVAMWLKGTELLRTEPSQILQ